MLAFLPQDIDAHTSVAPLIPLQTLQREVAKIDVDSTTQQQSDWFIGDGLND
jgi:hypothetical protein